MSAENTLTREVRTESGAARRKIVGAQFDQVLLYAVLALCAIGLVMVYSASSVSAATRYGDSAYFLKRQIAAALLGVGGLVAMLKIRYLTLRRWAYPILIAVIVRNGEIIIPEGSSCLQAGDDVIIIARGSGILDLNDIYRDKAGGAQ